MTDSHDVDVVGDDSGCAASLPRLRCRISSDLDTMQSLHEAYGWVPGRENIRPSAATLQRKQETMARNGHEFDVDEWSHDMFGVSWSQALAGNAVKKYHFVPNPFPYDIPRGTHHSVLWFPTEKAMPDHVVNATLEKAVDKLGGTEFVWYINPKMTVQAIWHVQVFWRMPSPSPQ